MSLLETRIVAKPWGCVELPAPFTNPGKEAVGEIWFEPPASFAEILVKYIFTSENLSVQCHPSDNQTLAQGLGKQGKEECWLVLDAAPGARLAIGFNDAIDAPAMRDAAVDGTIEGLLTWHSVVAGDFFYIPANTVHAIGSGVTLIEVQQNSDITYRLYDYGRPRELHLDQGITVALGEPYPADMHRRLSLQESTVLVEGPHFRLDLICGTPRPSGFAHYQGPLLVAPIKGSFEVNGTVVTAGQCAFATSLEEVFFPLTGRCLITQPLGT